MKNILRNTILLVLALSLLCGCTGGKPAETDGTEPVGTDGDPVVESAYPVKSVKIDGEDLSAFHILYSENDGPSVRTAAGDLQKYIELATGAKLDVTTDESVPGKRIAIAVTEEDTENYSYKSDENGVTISGGRTRGAMYGAYGFLENCLGIRFLASDTDYFIPSDGIELNALDYSFTQYFEFRDSYWYDYMDAAISAKRMINVDIGTRPMPEEYGGSVTFAGRQCHTIAELGEFEDDAENPPCYCSEELYETVLKNVFKTIEEHPESKIISVSQMDKTTFCRCDECRKVLREEKSQMGSILRFVNRIAEEVEKVYPDVLVHTLAYLDTEKAPKVTVPRDNVIIQLCTTAQCFYEPLETVGCEANDALRSTFEDWGNICQRVYVWDYCSNFYYFLVPFADFDSLYANVRFYYEHGCRGLFSEGNYKCISCEFGELRAYLTARLMQNPYMTEEEYDDEINLFLKGYYGAGWENIRRYYDHVMSCKNGDHFLGDYPYYLPEKVLDLDKFKAKNSEMVEWFNEAEALAADEKELKHIQNIRLSCDFTRLGSIFHDEYDSGDDARKAAVIEEVRSLVERIRNHEKIQLCEFAYKHPIPEADDVERSPFEW